MYSMAYNEFILTVNSSAIILLLVLALILLTATRFRSESGYAAAIIVVPNVPVYLYNMSRMLGWHDFTLVMRPISYSVNTLLMPLLWLFAKKNFDADFRLKPIHLLHLLPALLCLVICLSLSTEEQMSSILNEMSGEDTWIGNLNTIIVFLQMVGYFTAIFLFLAEKGYIEGRIVPIVVDNICEVEKYINPIPSGLVLTGIVVSVSVSALMLSLTVRLYQRYRTLDLDEISAELRKEGR